jgi:hypothetical protein
MRKWDHTLRDLLNGKKKRHDLAAVRPPLFLLTALVWLLVSILLGFYFWTAKALGLPTIPQLRLIHVHSALVGGATQMIFGALLTFIPPLLMVPYEPKKSRALQYLLLNGGVLGMVVGFGTLQYPIVGLSGLAIGLAFLLLLGDTLSMVRKSLSRPGLHLWFYGLAVLSLFGGIVLGELIAFAGLDPENINPVRLAHLHLNLLGFVTLTIIGTMQTMFPTVSAARLASDRLAVLAFVLLPTGVAGLVAGFLLGVPLVQVVAGVIVLLGVSVFGSNILRTWWAAPTKWSLPVLHLLGGTGWLALTVMVGILLAWNNRTEPPAYPIGTAHLMSYSHMALIGFFLQTIIGALSHLLPVILALTRVNNQKERRHYLERLTAQVEQWKWIQVSALNLGILIMAAWGPAAGIFGLGATPTRIAMWAAVALLILGVALFAGKVGLLLRNRPTDQH